MSVDLEHGWKLERYPLINTLIFRKGDRVLTWMDNQWHHGRDDVLVPAPGVAHALTMKAAEVAGRRFIHQSESIEEDAR